MTPGSSLPRGTPTCGSRSSCARSARAHSPGWTPRSPSMPPGSSSPRWTPSIISHCRPPGVTASGRVPHSRSPATMPDLAEVLADHLAHLRLLGRSERTVYDRERAVIRLAAWLGARYAGERLTAWLPARVQAAEQSGSEGTAGLGPAGSVLTATAADLAAWRAPPTVGGPARVVYFAHAARVDGFAVTPGIRPDHP